jgi:hypothetical protein
MKETLFISYYDHENCHDCLAMSSQLIDNNINILHIFTDQQVSNLYHRYCYIQNKNHIKCLNNKSNKLSTIISEYKNLYKKFFFLNTSKIIINNCNIKINNLDQPIYIKDLGYVVSFKHIIDFDRESVTYEDVFSDNLISRCIVNNKIDNIINLKDKVKIDKIKNNYNYTVIANNQAENVHYEDFNCLFAIFAERKDNLKKSPAYFNKNNNKIYSVHNNCLGSVVDYSFDKISIEWVINTEKFITSYNKNSNNMYM